MTEVASLIIDENLQAAGANIVTLLAPQQRPPSAVGAPASQSDPLEMRAVSAFDATLRAWEAAAAASVAPSLVSTLRSGVISSNGAAAAENGSFSGQAAAAALAPMADATVLRANCHALAALLSRRPPLSNTLVASLFQAVVALGKLAPPAALAPHAGRVLAALMNATPQLSPTVARVARVAAKNFIRRLGPRLFSDGCADMELLSWVESQLAAVPAAGSPTSLSPPKIDVATAATSSSLSGVPDSTTLEGFESDREIAVALLDRMCRVPHCFVGAHLAPTAEALLPELGPQEHVIVAAFVARVRSADAESAGLSSQPQSPPLLQRAGSAANQSAGALAFTSPAPVHHAAMHYGHRDADTVFTAADVREFLAAREAEYGAQMRAMDSELQRELAVQQQLARQLAQLRDGNAALEEDVRAKARAIAAAAAAAESDGDAAGDDKMRIAELLNSIADAAAQLRHR